MSLLAWHSFPVILLAVWAGMEALALLFRSPAGARWWNVAKWALRPGAVWSLYSIVYRHFANYGFNDRTTFPFAFVPWHEQDGWSTCLTRLLHSPTCWTWSAAVLLLGILFVMLCRWFLSTPMTGSRTALALAWLVLLNIAMPLAYNCLPDGAEDPLENKGSFLYAWFQSGNTLLYCMPHIENKSYYLKHFQEIQPTLAVSIHGVSHPPGASLALYWLGKPFGATCDVDKDRLRYALGTTVFAALAVLSMFFLGRTITGSNVMGLMGAALWAVKPATLAYNTFAPDPLYSVFNLLGLAFTWKAVTSPKRPWFSLVGLGIALYVQSLLNFNWILFAGMFGIFLTTHALQSGWSLKEWLIRSCLPAGILFGLLIWTCVTYHLNYLAIYRYALVYTHRFYPMTGLYQWLMALIGGPLDLFLLCGTLAACWFWRLFPVAARRSRSDPLVVFLLTMLGVYLVTAISVNILKMESSRVWAWATALPLVFVARGLHQSGNGRFYFLAAVVFAMIQYYAMQLFLTPCG